MTLEEILKKRENVFLEIANCYECGKKQSRTTDKTDLCNLHFHKMTYLLGKASKITRPLERKKFSN